MDGQRDSQRGTQKGLLALPKELLDNILSHLVVVQYPTDPTVKFSQPILWVCRRLWHQGVSLIVQSRIWLRVIIHTEGMIWTHRLSYRLHSSSDLCKQFLPPDIPCLTFELGEAGSPQQEEEDEEEEEEEVASDGLTLILPFEYDLFAQLCLICIFKDDWNHHQPGRVSCPSASFPAPLHKMADDLVLPFLFDAFCPLQAPPPMTTEGFEYRWTADAPPLVKQQQDLSTKGLFQALCRTLAVNQRLQQVAGYEDEADLFLLYQGRILCQLAAACLPPPVPWLLASHNPGPYNPSWWVSDPTTMYRNSVVSMLCQIECRAALVYDRWSRRCKDSWGYTGVHLDILTELGKRWLDEPHWQWIGLSNHQLAQIHHTRAVILKLEADMTMMMMMMHDSKVQSDPLKLNQARRNVERAAQELYIAKHLHPENELYARLFTEYAASFSGSSGSAGSNYRCWSINYTDLAGQPQRWIGDLNMVVGWGGKRILRFVPLAQRNLDHLLFHEDEGGDGDGDGDDNVNTANANE